jgi:tetratricopeptide (TPR) repeat protein
MDLSEFDIDFLSQKLSDNPQSPLFARLADLYLSKNQSSEALKLCEAGVQVFSSYATGYVVLGKCYLSLNENSKARLAFSQALHFAPFNQVARKLLDEIPLSADESLPVANEEPTTADPSFTETAATPEPLAAEITLPEPAAAEQSVELPQSDFGPVDAAPSVEEISQEHTYENPPVEVDLLPAESAGLSGIDDYIQQHSEGLASDEFISLDNYLEGAAPIHEPPATELDALVVELESASRIVPPEPEPRTSPAENSPLDSTVITPTLAEIYASQGEYGAAIQAYEILLLSKPGERERFEKRIKELQAKLFDGE